MLIEKL